MGSTLKEALPHALVNSRSPTSTKKPSSYNNIGRTVSGLLTGSDKIGSYLVPSDEKDAIQAFLKVITNVLGAQSRWVGASLEAKSVRAIAIFKQRYSPGNRRLC